jgi:ribose 5-phosphate isomerase
LDSVVGLVEHGLFIGMTSQVIVGGKHGVDTLQPGSGAAARKL